MDSGDTAQLAAVLGALGAALLLLARGRATVLAGIVLIGAAEATFGAALLPEGGLSVRRGALAVAGLLVLCLPALLLARRPALVFPLALLAAPLRLPIDIGSDNRFLLGAAEPGRLGRLHLLYFVIAIAVLALALRALRGARLPALPLVVALPAASFLVVASLSLLWAEDVDSGATKLAFFLLPFAALVGVAGRTPFEGWVPRALALVLLTLVSGFAAIGLWQAWSRDLLFYAPSLEIANAYASFFRVTSLFTDPSLYGRHLILGIAVLVVLFLRERINPPLGIALVALMWGGLFFSYSQSSFVALIIVVAALALAAGDRRLRRTVLLGGGAAVLLAAGVVALSVEDASARRFTSGRSQLVSTTAEVIKRRPLVGVGLGSQPLVTREVVGPGAPLPRYTSHTTPLTVAAELGLAGFAAYLALLVGTTLALLRVRRSHATLGLALGAILLALVVHSLFYSGFYEDPLTWGVLGVACSFLATRPTASA